MRVYVATTIGGLQALRSNGFVQPEAVHAVTAALREWYVEADAGELEYAASCAAAESSLRMLVPGEPARRVVVAAEVPDSWVRPAGGTRAYGEPAAGDPSSVLVGSPVPLDLVVSVHLDGADAEPEVAAAAAALPASDAGDDDARRTVGDAEGHELLWYDVSELDDVLTPFPP